MEKMYHMHNAQMSSMSTMVTTLARLAGYGSKDFATAVRDVSANKDYADDFNKALDEIMENTENGKS